MHSLHDLRVLTRAQRRKLSTSAGTDTPTDPGSDHDPKRTPSPAPTVEEDDSSMDPPSLPDLSVHHPSSDSDSDDDSPHTTAHVPRSASQAFAPSSQRYSFERITAHAGPLRRGHKKYLGLALPLI